MLITNYCEQSYLNFETWNKTWNHLIYILPLMIDLYVVSLRRFLCHVMCWFQRDKLKHIWNTSYLLHWTCYKKTLAVLQCLWSGVVILFAWIIWRSDRSARVKPRYKPGVWTTQRGLQIWIPTMRSLCAKHLLQDGLRLLFPQSACSNLVRSCTLVASVWSWYYYLYANSLDSDKIL